MRVTQPEPWATVTGGSFLPDVDIPPYYLQPAEKSVSGWNAEDRWELLRTALPTKVVNTYMRSPQSKQKLMSRLAREGIITQEMDR